ncbi:MAG: hypothetical protein QOF21_2377 [Actinomycetota bacterium]|jgi:hypothetical protein
MSSESNLTDEEIDAQEASKIPDKEAMSLLDINADLDLALDIAAPIDAAVAANANAAIPLDAAVAANALSPDSIASASADQDSIIVQDLDGVAEANATQAADIDQSGD